MNNLVFSKGHISACKKFRHFCVVSRDTFDIPNIIIIIIIQKICSAHISTLLGAQGANPETPGQVSQLYAPSEGRSNCG